MFDLKWIRERPEELDAGLGRRGLAPVSAQVLDLDARRRKAQTELQDLQARRNEASRAIGEAKRTGADASAQLAEVARLKDRLAALEDEERRLGRELEDLLAGLPNVPAPDVPDGPDETANRIEKSEGERPRFDFTPKQHFELGESLGLLDFETAAKLSGARFVVMRGAIARLHRALGQFMIDLHTREHGYTEVVPPYLVRDEALFGTGQLPKFSSDLFVAQAPDEEEIERIEYEANVSFETEVSKILADRTLTAEQQSALIRKLHKAHGARMRERQREARRTLWLIPTAEVPLTNLVTGEILEEAALPLRVTALTPCFRSEAGAAGKDTRGMLRQHQFDKVELVSITHPERSEEEHERMTACAEEVLKRLGLHYRVVTLCTGDMGFAARKTYDIEVWLPGQERYREISSCSNCWDFQARRMMARVRPASAKATAGKPTVAPGPSAGPGSAKAGTRFVHSLNGSGVAVGRCLIALMETYQRADGSIALPDVLHPYMGGATEIRADA